MQNVRWSDSFRSGFSRIFFQRLVAFVSVLVLLPHSSFAATCTPATETGKLRYASGVAEFCDGTNWVSTKNAAGAACAAGIAGKIAYSGSEYQFCDGTSWYSMKNSVATSCTAGEAGKKRFSSSMMQFCDGTNWYNMATAAAAPAGGIALESTVTGTASATNTVSTSGITTPANVLLVATIEASGSTNLFNTISGAGLTWTLVPMTARMYTAYAFTSTALSNQVITANFTESSASLAMVVSAYSGVDTNSSDGHNAFNLRINTSGATLATTTMSDTTTRVNSLMMFATCAETTGATTAASGQTMNGVVDTGSISVAHSRKNAITATKGTSVSMTHDFSVTTGNAGVHLIEILGPQPVYTTPSIEWTRTMENSGGSTSMNIVQVSTEVTNELLLLAVTTKTNVTINTPTGGATGWTSMGKVTHATTGLTTEVFRGLAEKRLTKTQVEVTFGTSVKATMILTAIKGMNKTGTNGSGAIDAFVTGSGSTANPSVNVTPATENSLVIGFLGNGYATAPTVSAGFTLNGSTFSSGGGGATSKLTSAYQSKNTLSPASVAVPVTFTETAIDWNQFSISIKP